MSTKISIYSSHDCHYMYFRIGSWNTSTFMPVPIVLQNIGIF